MLSNDAETEAEEVVKEEFTAGDTDLINQNSVADPGYDQPEVKPENARVGFKFYKVASGDSLLSICDTSGIDYYSTYRIILSINGIENANMIYEGQTLLLPVE